jgi:cephalosporin hydroxylase/glycosyltransferase involved in cell wall biosynthesis
VLSVIIPSRNEQGYLEKTIESLLNNAEGEIEIIVVLDGWLPNPRIEFPTDARRQLVWIHNPEAIGQRQAINQAARQAKGEFIMKLDAHCAVDKGFDVILARDCEYDMTMIPRMYNLNVVDWTPKLHKRTDYMYIGLVDGNLRAQYYEGKDSDGNTLRQPDNDKMIDEVMCCMGPCFFMRKARFWELGGCMEEHGGWGQQGVEESCKAWTSGGRMIVNKNTWFAHWFRGGGVPEGHKKGFPYRLTQRDVEIARNYSNDLWMNNKWPKQVKTFEWLLDKFDPPGWGRKKPQVNPDGSVMSASSPARAFFNHMMSGNKMPTWMGYTIIKYPNDLILYQQKLFEQKPDVLVEVGTHKGGSALFFAQMMDLIGHGRVISIDRSHDKYPLPQHPRITYLTGRSTATETLGKVKDLVNGSSVMVVLDGDHSRTQVKRELVRYSDVVTPGQYLVAEDTVMGEMGMSNNPAEAVEWFLKRTNKVRRERPEEQFMLSCNSGGWLRRV